ncbi:hypothetical protein DFJ73DRAFT_852321 [Zopfochytrium polystomum]|nr:hypothetical protein DFJ73DRAFT_852321 [Zopfochytrium polystomum]
MIAGTSFVEGCIAVAHPCQPQTERSRRSRLGLADTPMCRPQMSFARSTLLSPCCVARPSSANKYRALQLAASSWKSALVALAVLVVGALALPNDLPDLRHNLGQGLNWDEPNGPPSQWKERAGSEGARPNYFNEVATTPPSSTPDPCGIMVEKGAKPVWTVPEVLNCYNSFSLLTAVRDGQIESLKSHFQMHPYLDQLASSSAPFFHANVDLLEELEKIRRDTSITTELAFHSRIIDLVKSLRDGHTAYEPACFQAFLFFQPWIIGQKYPGGSGSPTVYLKNVVNAAADAAEAEAKGSTPDSEPGASLLSFWKSAGVELSKYLGWTVSKINGLDAVLFIQQEADTEYGVSRVKDTRFNKMFPAHSFQMGSWKLVDSALYQKTFIRPTFPSSWQYELSPPQGGSGSPVSVTVPWGAIVHPMYKDKLTSRESYYTAVCMGKPTGQNSQVPPSTKGSTNIFDGDIVGDGQERIGDQVSFTQERGKFADMMRPRWDVSKAIAYSRQMAASIAAEDSRSKGHVVNDDGGAGGSGKAAFSLSTPILKDSVNAFYDLGDGVTGVWAFASVAPPSMDDDTLSAWMALVATGLVALESRGLTKLIIDVSNNPGGVVCAGQAFVKFLFPNMQYVNYDIRRTPLTESLITAAFTGNDSDSFWSLKEAFIPSLTGPGATSPTSPKPSVPIQAHANTTSDILSDDPAYLQVRGGRLGQYTRRFEMDCVEYFVNMTKLPQLKKGWEGRNIAVVSNGLCGSTCSNIVRVLRDQFKVQSYVYGGRGAAFQPTSFEGGKLVDFGRVQSEISELLAKQNGKSAPGSGSKAPESGNRYSSVSTKSYYDQRSQMVPPTLAYLPRSFNAKELFYEARLLSERQSHRDYRRPKRRATTPSLREGRTGGRPNRAAENVGLDMAGVETRWSDLLGQSSARMPDSDFVAGTWRQGKAAVNAGGVPGTRGSSAVNDGESDGSGGGDAGGVGGGGSGDGSGGAAGESGSGAELGGADGASRSAGGTSTTSKPAPAAPPSPNGSSAFQPPAAYVSNGFTYPFPLVRPARASLPFWEGYSRYGSVTTLPMEWMPQPAEHLVVVEDPLDTAAVWTKVAELMRMT